MSRLRIIAIIGLVYLAGVVTSPLWIGLLHAYEESTGSWSATEKRQVIRLLEKIEQNTRSQR